MKRFAELVKMMEVARERYNEENLQAAKAEFDRIEERTAKEGVRSAALLMGRAATLESLGRDEDAFRAVCEAVMIDPLDPTCQERFSALSSKVRENLASETSNDDAIPRLHALLSSVGETDASSHLALARFYLAKDDVNSARKLLDAVILLQPATAEAWTLRAEVAVRQGDEASADGLSLRAREALGAARGQVAQGRGAN